MVSINTNLSSLMVQGNLNQATNGLNKAIERLSTGYKINHSSDNAANYSIANNYEAKLSSFDMAADNVGMGSDLLAVAQDTISSMQDHGARLHALITQARNGTYGAQSLNALTQEAGALISEIQRMYSNAEYNNVNLFDNLLPTWAKNVREETTKAAGIAEGETVGLTKYLTPKYNGFIENAKTYTDEEVAAMTKVSDVENFVAGEKYSISSKEELAKLATKVNSGADTTNVEFVLASDIDLSSIDNWDAIGNYDINTDTLYDFLGIFDGNGHVIKNLRIDKSTTDYQGLFGVTGSGSEIKNIGIVDCVVNGGYNTGGLVGFTWGTISNSYATGDVTGTSSTGGLVGHAWETISNSYATGSVTGLDNTGGLVGHAVHTVTDSFAICNVSGGECTGGLAGVTKDIVNCYAAGNVIGLVDDEGYRAGGIGGLVGYACDTIINCYASGNVIGSDGVGGLAGSSSDVTNSYAIGTVSGTIDVGGLVGWSRTVTNCYAKGNVKIIKPENPEDTEYEICCEVGGLVGRTDSSSIINSYATGNISIYENANIDIQFVGGLVGRAGESDIIGSYATGNVNIKTGRRMAYTGGLVGIITGDIKNSYATGYVVGQQLTGGLAGVAEGAVSNSYAIGSVLGTREVGGLVGGISDNITNSYATGNVKGTSSVGGLAGMVGCEGSATHDKLFAGGKVSGDDKVGSLIGIIANTEDGTTFSTINITNAKVLNQDYAIIAFEGKCVLNGNHVAYESGQMAGWLENIKEVKSPETTLQVGIHGDESSKITFDTGFSYDLSAILRDIKSDKAYNAINKFMSTLSDKATELGSVSNRLESALDSIIVNMENITSSLSTIKDADMATESSQYIKMQILQQASATLLATANQSPSIALQLI